MSFDYSKLKGKIIEVFDTVEKFSIEANMSATTAGRKLSGKSPWSQDEIMTACELLGIPVNDITKYFFAQKVEKTQQKAV